MFKDFASFDSGRMHHEEILRELYALERFGMKLGLANITELLHRIGGPHLRFPAAHVTGSNGKGSVCAFIESILREAGYNVGLYTSPHLIRFNERIRVGGREIPDEDVARLYEFVKPHAAIMAAESKAKQPTFFEITTAMAFQYFAEKEVKLAVVEVGMGGGMDATNVVRPETCVITRVSLEHTEHLGRTIRRIAKEKSGILKPGVPVVTLNQEALATIEERAKELGCPLTVVGREATYRRIGGTLAGQTIEYSGSSTIQVSTVMAGAHQVENVALALAATSALESRGWNVGDDAKRVGIARMRWPARFQLVRRTPPVLIDGAHNPGGAQCLHDSLTECLPGRRVVLVMGMLADKDLTSYANTLAPLTAHSISTRPKSERAYPPEEVTLTFKKLGISSEVIEDVPAAIRRGLDLASRDRPLLITGSLYLAGEALQHFQEGTV
jgi:dihydrofolate synthase/folylpolyglutamate synthase